MRAHRLTALALFVLAFITGLAAWVGGWPGNGVGLSWGTVVAFYGVPLLLGGLLVRGRRWVLMAAVIYGTVGLAFDIATVALLPAESDGVATLASSTARGLCNLAIITQGWRGVLSDWPAPSSAA